MMVNLRSCLENNSKSEFVLSQRGDSFRLWEKSVQFELFSYPPNLSWTAVRKR